MYYFVNEYLYDKNSGIEHAEFKRLQLFKHLHVPAKLVTREYNPMLHRIITKFGLESDDVVNMFDFFQGAVQLDTDQAKIQRAAINSHYELEPDPTISKVYRGDLLNNRVLFIAGTYGQLNVVESFDRYQNLIRAEQWDWRGFKSCIKYYDADRKVIREEYLNPEGTVVIEAAYGSDGIAQSDMTYIRLVNYQGEDYYFYNIEELFDFFLSELDEQQTPGENTYIADRPLTTYKPVMNIPGTSRKFIYLPMVQTEAEANDKNRSYILATGKLNPIYEYAFAKKNIDKLSGIIVATKAQQADIADRVEKIIHADVPVIAIPAATVPGPQTTPTTKKDQIIFVGRLGNGKGIVRLIDMFQQIHNKLTTLKLLIYGYGEAEASARQEAKNLGIEDVVDFKDYQVDLKSAYAESKLFVTTTETDVEPLAMTEAASFGLPMVAFDIPYGPREVIHDGWNGLLFRDGELKEMAEGIVALLKDPQRLEEYGTNAKKTAEQFSDAEIGKLWQEKVIKHGVRK